MQLSRIWRFVSIVITLAWGVSLISATCHAATGMGWTTDESAAFRRAKQERKPVLIHFHADWCGPCRQMDATIFSTSQFQSQLKRSLVGLSVDADARGDLLGRYKVTSLPSDILIDGEGKELRRSVGTVSLDQYLAFVHVPTPPAKPANTVSSASHAAPAKAPTVHTVQKIAPPAISAPATTKGPVATPSPAPAAQPAPAVMRPLNLASTAAAPVAAGPPPAAKLVPPAKAPPTQPKVPTKALDSAMTHDGYLVGLRGHSPVSLIRQGKLVTGKKEFVVLHKGVAYLLSDVGEKQQFEADPERFTPAMHGFDPVAYRDQSAMVSGMLEHIQVHRSRVFVFQTAENRDRFLANVAAFEKTPEITLFRSL